MILAVAGKRITSFQDIQDVFMRFQVAENVDILYRRGRDERKTRMILEEKAKKKTISYEEAKEPYLKCIEADPNFADAYSQLGNVFLWTDDEQKALENYTKAIEHDPTEIRYYPQLADLYIRLGYVSEAEQVLKEAKSFAKEGDKYMFGVHNLLASVYQERGNISENPPPQRGGGKA